MKTTNIPWVDKYRPTKLTQIIQQTEIINILLNMVKLKNIPHMLFYGPPGTGKTSTIYALATELFGDKIYDRILELNASDERGIGVVRNKITKFAKSSIGSSKDLIPPIKLIIMDEADAMTREAQSALRKLMETAINTRFCFICNYKSQIIEPIESRCACFRFKLIDDATMSNKLKFISIKEQINLNNDVSELISKLADGDARKAIMILQNLKYIYNGELLTVNDVKKVTGYFDDIDLNIEEFGNFSISKISKIVNKILNDGHPVIFILEHVKNSILFSKLPDNKKSKILIYLANIEVLLIEKGNENIQLLALFTFIHNILIDYK